MRVGSPAGPVQVLRVADGEDSVSGDALVLQQVCVPSLLFHRSTDLLPLAALLAAEGSARPRVVTHQSAEAG
eukprot:8856523-Pyramimonas_sp.AAC.1